MDTAHGHTRRHPLHPNARSISNKNKRKERYDQRLRMKDNISLLITSQALTVSTDKKEIKKRHTVSLEVILKREMASAREPVQL